MKITHMSVRNFRALEDVDVPFHDYTTFIGPNGAGKSTILYAFDWFFGNRMISKDDLTNGSNADEISVAVAFGSLTARDREQLGMFVCDDSATFKRTLHIGTGVVTCTGEARQGPGFDAMHADHRVTVVRPVYKQLQRDVDGLPDLGTNPSLEQIRTACADWVCDPANAAFVEVTDQSAANLFTTPGSLGELCQFILIKGSLDLASETDITAKNSLLNFLTNRLIETARSQIINEWQETNANALNDLRNQTRDAVTNATESISKEINLALSRYVARSKIKLDATDPNIEVRYPATVTPSIEAHDGMTLPVSSQGHGLQRAVAMSMIEALHSSAIEGEPAIKVTILGAEEPEIYQHPVRARSFAQTLKSLAAQEQFQVVLATHSSSFVSPDFVDSLRFVRIEDRTIQVRHTSVGRIAALRRRSEDNCREWLSREVPRAFTEAFFADLVVLVEGITDEWLIPELAEIMGTPFQLTGVVCVSAGSKSSVAMFKNILVEFGIPVFSIIDGDFHEMEGTTSQQQKSWRLQTEKHVKLLGLQDANGNPLYTYGDPSLVLDSAAILQRNLEYELLQWPSFQQHYVAANNQDENKNAYRYRTSARSSRLEDMPDFFRQLVERIMQSAGARQEWYDQP